MRKKHITREKYINFQIKLLLPYWNAIPHAHMTQILSSYYAILIDPLLRAIILFYVNFRIVLA